MSDEMPERRPGRLRRLRVTRVDRVAAGANPDAHVVLYKREDLEDPTTSAEDVITSTATATSGDDRLTETETPEMTEIDREILAPEIAEMIATLEAERDAAVAKVAELETQTVGDDDEPTDEPTDDEVLKALDPTVRERIEKAETERAALVERIAKMEDEALVASYVAKASEYRTIETDVDGLGALLADVAKNCVPERAQMLERVLKAATARLDEAHRLITAEIGTAAALDATDAGRQIESLAKARAEQTGESMPVATAAILNDNPHLYEQARAERA